MVGSVVVEGLFTLIAALKDYQDIPFKAGWPGFGHTLTPLSIGFMGRFHKILLQYSVVLFLGVCARQLHSSPPLPLQNLDIVKQSTEQLVSHCLLPLY